MTLKQHIRELAVRGTEQILVQVETDGGKPFVRVFEEILTDFAKDLHYDVRFDSKRKERKR